MSDTNGSLQKRKASLTSDGVKRTKSRRSAHCNCQAKADKKTAAVYTYWGSDKCRTGSKTIHTGEKCWGDSWLLPNGECSYFKEGEKG